MLYPVHAAQLVASLVRLSEEGRQEEYKEGLGAAVSTVAGAPVVMWLLPPAVPRDAGALFGPLPLGHLRAGGMNGCATDAAARAWLSEPGLAHLLRHGGARNSACDPPCALRTHACVSWGRSGAQILVLADWQIGSLDLV